MTEPTCVNLRDRFGARYRIGFDPAYDPKHRPREKLDPWMMVIPCERGEIYPHGGDQLAVDVEGRQITANKVRSLACTTVHQEGDNFVCCLFDVTDFDEVAALVKPRKRRRLTEDQRAETAERLKKHQFQSRKPTQAQSPKTASEPSTRPQGQVDDPAA